MNEHQTEAWMQAVDAWLAELHRDLRQRLSVYTLPAPPKVGDFQ